MPLAPGDRLGPFAVVGLLGEGGMGEVYRARDTTLDRDVALKLLPDSFATDPDRLMRFEREAKTLASLNHSNIAHIHGVEDEGALRALVMELVEGPTLAEVIALGLQLDDALDIARQIADALEAAHEQGIIHRDLKPANIKVRADGVVKVLDFGLAKALDSAAGGRLAATGATRLAPEVANSPTMMSPAMTMHGAIVGTAAYMSPEQARGKPVDRRADIWAYGCVLFEMLSGRAAFAGETVTDVLGSVVRDEPDWSRLAPGTPTALHRVMRRCLVKDPRKRLQAIGDARIEIEEAASPSPRAEAVTVARPVASLRWGAIALASAAALVVGATGGAFWPRAASTGDGAPIQLEVPPPANELWGLSPRVAVSPDGKELLIALDNQPAGLERGSRAGLYRRTLDNLTARIIAGTEGARAPFWAPDMKKAGFFADGKLKTVDLQSGVVQAICNAMMSRAHGTWAGNTIVFSGELRDPIQRVDASGGAPAIVVPASNFLGRPSFLPDGKRFLFHSDQGILIASIDGGEPTVLVPGANNGQPAGPDRIAFNRGRTLYVQRFDPSTLKLHGEPLAVASAPRSSATASTSVFSIGGGSLVYPVDVESTGRLAWVDRSGRRLSWASDARHLLNPELGPGERIVYESAPSDTFDIWLVEGEGRSRRLTNDTLRGYAPLWSHARAQVAFNVTSGERASLGMAPVRVFGLDGSSSELIRQSPEITSWSPDGRMFLAQQLNGPTNRDVMMLDATADGAMKPFVATAANELHGQFSPDGRWVAYAAESAGRYDVFITDFPRRLDTIAVSSGGGVQPRWRGDGREIYYLSPDSQLMAVPLELSERVNVGKPAPLFEARTVQGFVAAMGTRAQYAPALDGSRFVMNLEQERRTVRFFTILNWPRLVDGR